MTYPAAFRIAIVSLTFLLAGTVKGVTGMGLPTVAMGVLGAFMLPAEAAALLILPSFITNAWQLLAGPRLLVLFRRFWPMMAGIACGTVLAVSLMTGSKTHWAVIGLGTALTLYAASGLLAWRFTVPARHERRLSPLIGVVTGLITGGTGVAVVPAAPYLQSLDLKKEDLVQALGMSFTVSTIALATGLAHAGAFAIGDARDSLLAVVPALAGMWIGQRIRGRISPASFRRWFFLCLLALGLQLIVRQIV